MVVLEPDDTLPDTYYLTMAETEGTYVLYFTSEEPPSDEDGNPVRWTKQKNLWKSIHSKAVRSHVTSQLPLAPIFRVSPSSRLAIKSILDRRLRQVSQ